VILSKSREKTIASASTMQILITKRLSHEGGECEPY